MSGLDARESRADMAARLAGSWSVSSEGERLILVGIDAAYHAEAEHLRRLLGDDAAAGVDLDADRTIATDEVPAYIERLHDIARAYVALRAAVLAHVARLEAQ